MTPRTAAQLFRRTYGRDPAVVVSAPGRVNLIGEHTDYNGGEVLPIAIGLTTFVAMDRGSAPVSRAVSGGRGARQSTFRARAPRREGRWCDYVAGSVAEVAREALDLSEVDVAIASDVPSGAGVSSSAALEVATVGAAMLLAEGHMVPMDVALAAHRAETQFVGVACGIMDQFACALSRAGHALHLWCDRQATEDVPFAGSILVFDTATPRSLRGSEYNTRRAECARALVAIQRIAPTLTSLAAANDALVGAADMGDTERRRARHVVTEVARVQKCVAALKATGQLDGHLLTQSHASLRDLYECSTEELDWFVDYALSQDGVTGARLTGAGWGGCAIAAGERAALQELARRAPADLFARFGRAGKAFITTASGGLQSHGRAEFAGAE